MLSPLNTNKLDIEMLNNEITNRSNLNDFVSRYVAYQCACLTLINDFTK